MVSYKALNTSTEEIGKTYMISSCFFFGMVALEKVQVSGFNPKFVVYLGTKEINRIRVCLIPQMKD